MRKILRYILLLVLVALLGTALFNELSAQKDPKVESHSLGESMDGRLENGVRLPYKGHNFKYFSVLSYYILNRAYVNSHVYRTVLQAYGTMDSLYPGREFRIMECGRKKGGKIIGHRSHQRGLSVDFMTPLLHNGKPTNALTWLGIWHYTLKFNDQGCRKSNCIDFDLVGAHLIALDDACRKNGLRIRLVVFKKELHDELMKSRFGAELKRRNIRIPVMKNDTINAQHDDHYHIEFEVTGPQS